METSPDTAARDALRPPSRWSQALAGNREDLLGLAGSFWYTVFLWWRRSGREEAGLLTQMCFGRWLADNPPQPADSCANRFREWILDRLEELSGEPAEAGGEVSIELDLDWAEERYALEPEGSPEEVFQRRWALAIVEFTMQALRAEYVESARETLFDEVAPFAAHEIDNDARYTEAAGRLRVTVGAARKAVFDFRSRYRELLRGFIADTVADPAEIDGELTVLLAACEPAGVSAQEAPIPTAIRAFKPGELLARGLRSVRMTSGAGQWTPPSDHEVAQLFPQFEVLGLVGRGGMGAVYQARQVSLDRCVAIKLLPLEVSVDPVFVERFRREARALAKLNHPNIISVHEFGQTTEGHLFFVMEFVDGETLHDLIHNREPLPPAVGIGLVEQVCDALAFAHSKGIVHRDIKPANVMVDREGRAKVADFGLARLNESAVSEDRGSTMMGAIMGTPDYMAPEQKRGLAADHRVDLYAVGVLLYEALCRETPQGAFVLPSRRCGLDKRLDGVITKALAPEPEARYQKAVELRMALEAIRPAVAKAQAKKVAAAPVEGTAGVKSRVPLFAGVAAAVLLVAGAAFLLSRPKSHPVAPANSTPTAATPALVAATPTPPPSETTPPAGTPRAVATVDTPPAQPDPAAPPPPTATPAPATPTPAPLSITGKWIAEQEPQWQAAFAAEVNAPYEKGVADLKKQYQASVEAQLANAARTANLDEAVAFRAERERLNAGTEMPAADDAQATATLRNLRAGYRASLVRLETDRTARLKSVHARIDAILLQNQSALTRVQRIAEAVEVKARRERLANEWLKTPAAATPAPLVAVATPAPVTPPPPSISSATPVKGEKLPPRQAAERLIALNLPFSYTLPPNVMPHRVTSADQLPEGDFVISQLDFVPGRSGPRPDADFAILESLPELTMLQFAGLEFADSLIAKVGNLHKLRTLIVSARGDFTGSTLGALAANPDLTSLIITSGSTMLSEEGLKALAKLSQLKFLTFGSVLNPDETLKAVAGMTNLKTLSISVPPGRAKPVGELFANWPVNPGLESLFTQGLPVSDGSLRNIAKTFPNLRMLTLSTSPGSPTAAGAAQLAALHALFELDCYGDGVDDATAVEIGKIPNLNRLILDRAKITEVGAAGLSKLTSLRYLMMYDPPVTDAALKSFAKMTGLTSFRLQGGSKTKPEVRQKLKEALPNAGVE